MTQTVLLAGATGMLGSQIALSLMDQPEARLRLLVLLHGDYDLLAISG